MRGLRRVIWSVAAAVALAGGSFSLGMHVASPAAPRADAQLGPDLAGLRGALERYHADRGWYPGDPDRDYNDSGRMDLLRRQLTEFTRDDGRPAPRRDAEYCFGPYLREFPADPRTGSRQVILDQNRSRSLALLHQDVEAGNGAGGWYYEVRTGNIVLNHGRGRAGAIAGRARFAAF
jgi:hypothetical protein